MTHNILCLLQSGSAQAQNAKHACKVLFFSGSLETTAVRRPECAEQQTELPLIPWEVRIRARTETSFLLR